MHLVQLHPVATMQIKHQNRACFFRIWTLGYWEKDRMFPLTWTDWTCLVRTFLTTHPPRMLRGALACPRRGGLCSPPTMSKTTSPVAWAATLLSPLQTVYTLLLRLLASLLLLTKCNPRPVYPRLRPNTNSQPPPLPNPLPLPTHIWQ